MTKKLQISFLTLLGLITFSTIAMGQVNMNRRIELTVTPGSLVQISLSNDSLYISDIMIESGDSVYNFSIFDDWHTGTYYADSSTMLIYGDIKKIYMHNNLNLVGLDASLSSELTYLCCNLSSLSNINVVGLINLEGLYCSSNKLSSITLNDLPNLTALAIEMTQLTTLDVSHIPNLIILHCGRNLLTNININGCDSLKSINCAGNQLSDCSIDSLFYSLPSRLNQLYSGLVYLTDSISIFPVIYSNPGTNTCRDTIATNRHWQVLEKLGNTINNIHNQTYGCTLSSDIEEITTDEIIIKVYPNPVSNALNIETDGKVNDIILYDVLGKEVMRTKKTNDIDVSSLNNGIYILKLITEKGIGEYKIVKE